MSGLRKTAFIDYDIAVAFLVKDLLNSFAGPYKVSDTQLASVCEAILTQYYYFTLEELVYVFGKAKSSVYGAANFSGIDQAQIMRWLEVYDLGERQSIVDSKRPLATKKVLSDLQLKELRTLIPFKVVIERFPDCTEADYLEATITDLQTLFLPTVLANKAKESGVSFDEFIMFFPKATPKTYLSKDSYELKTEFEKLYNECWELVIKDLQNLGFEPPNRNIMSYLSKLLKKDNEKYKKELSRLVIKLKKERRARLKRSFANYKKNKKHTQARRFGKFAYK